MSERGQTSGKSTTTGYRVEARVPFRPLSAVYLGQTLVTESWAHISFDHGKPGVPNHLMDRYAAERGVLSYDTANALVAWASANAYPLSIAIQFRLVKVRVEWSWTETELGVGEPINFAERERAAVFSPRSPEQPDPEAA